MYRTKDKRLYPYNTGLKLGCEMDVIITDENSEPVDATNFVKETHEVDFTGGGEEPNNVDGHNQFKAKHGMVRMYSKQSFCRAYSTDNIWFMLKHLVILLKKRAFLSFMPVIYGEDFEGLPDDMVYVAAGHIKTSVQSVGIYNMGPYRELNRMTYEYDDESHKRLLDNIRITVGLISLLLDRRESAEYRRQEYGPFSNKEFRKTKRFLTYQTPTNFWLFSPILAHLIYGAMRFAYFITQNNFEQELWEGFESGDIKNAIYHSSYDIGMEIWKLMKDRLADCGYKTSANPFAPKPAAILECLFENGVGIIGQGVYTNWRMNRRLKNFSGHFEDLPSWENGTHTRLFTNKHPQFDTVKKYLETL